MFSFGETKYYTVKHIKIFSDLPGFFLIRSPGLVGTCSYDYSYGGLLFGEIHIGQAWGFGALQP